MSTSTSPSRRCEIKLETTRIPTSVQLLVALSSGFFEMGDAYVAREPSRCVVAMAFELTDGVDKEESDGRHNHPSA